ncbi:amino acid ABC transporter permease [Candidatus Clostridium radicumherbarum]|uniref:Amino acid ABC transporter permease n=1 Tax=Candidatus Clostridium radicumherbarum TaxID=3381662 RepID=A0ABW8TX71_9CLOT
MDLILLLKDSLPSLFSGLAVTLKITATSICLATTLGLLFGLMSISTSKILRLIATIYIDIIRGTPLIVQAFFIYFGLPSAFALKMSAITAGIVTIGANAGAYMSEIFRGGILAVDKGQFEASRSLGLSYRQAMQKVILPQAIRNMIPAIINQFIISLKDTSLLTVIGIRELTQSGEIIVASTYKAFQIWTIVGAFYLIIITIISYTSRYIERKVRI